MGSRYTTAQDRFLVRAEKFWLLADEAALKGTMAAKESAGVRPCRNIYNVDYSMNSLHSITEPDFLVFRPLSVQKLQGYM